MKELDYYVAIADEEIEKDHDRDTIFQKIDNVANCEWTLPAAIANLPGMRKATLTDPADALSAATRTFSTLQPHFELNPMNPSEGEAQRMEMVEALLDWHFYTMNKRGASYPLWDIVNSALKYMTVAFQVEYLPYTFKKRTDLQAKYALACGDFVWHVHNPKSVHARTNAYGTQSVVLCVKKTVRDLITEFGEDNKGIKKLLKALKKDDDTDVTRTEVEFYDYTDWTDRVKWVKYEDNIELMREEHKLGFLPWVYKEGENPLLGKVVSANLYEDACLVASVERWNVLVTASHPAYFTKTPSGRGLNISYANPAGELRGKPGDEVSPMSPRLMDPHVSKIAQDLIASIHAATVTRSLQTLDFSANMPYSSMSAILTAAVASLSIYRKLAELAITEGLYQQLQWIKYSGQKSQGLRRYTKDEDNPMMTAGAPITMLAEPTPNMPSNFVYVDNPHDIQIVVELQADTATDKQQRVNMAMSMAQLGIPKSKLADDLNVQNFGILRKQWMTEQLEEAQIRAEMAKIEGGAQLEIQQAGMQMQMQMQQQAQQEQMGQQEASSQQGYATGQGGLPPQQMDPAGMNRIAVQGQDMTGQGMPPV